MSEEKRPEWMTSISANVDPEEYLSGRKIDKTFQLGQEEKAKRAREIREELIASNKLKLAADPILELERRKQQLKIELISNPLKLRKFREYLLKEEREKRGESSRSSMQNDTSLGDEDSGKSRRQEIDNHRESHRSHRSPTSSSSWSSNDIDHLKRSPSPDRSRSRRDRHKRSHTKSEHRYRDHHLRHICERSRDRDGRVKDRSRNRSTARHRDRSQDSHHHHLDEHRRSHNHRHRHRR